MDLIDPIYGFGYFANKMIHYIINVITHNRREMNKHFG